MRTSDDCWRVGGGELWWESLNSRTIKPRKVQPVRNLTGIQLRLHVLAGRTGAEEDPRPHSLRITGLNLLEKAGCPPWLLRVTGRWLVDCHYQYTGQDHNPLATKHLDRRRTPRPGGHNSTRKVPFGVLCLKWPTGGYLGLLLPRHPPSPPKP